MGIYTNRHLGWESAARVGLDSVAMDGNVKLHKSTQRYDANLI